MESFRDPRPTLGRLERVDPREYWIDEARDFTPWLGTAENLEILGQTIGLSLEAVGTERRVGPLRADIFARETGTENPVLIENQLERTNHDHLGKLITYASGLNARTIIWVARETSDDHRKAIEWLNDLTDESLRFFAVELELWKIGDSDPAPRFNVVAEPNEWAKSFRPRPADTEPTETKQLQLEFWRELIRYSEDRGTFLSLTRPRPQHWHTLAVGRSGFQISLTVNTREQRLGCALYISHSRAKHAFAQLRGEKEAIESELGSQLEWQELPKR